MQSDEEPALPPGWGGELVSLLRRLRGTDALHRVDGPMSVRQLARTAGLSAAHVSEVLRGKKRASPAVAEKLAQALGAAPQDVRLARFYAERLGESAAPLAAGDGVGRGRGTPGPEYVLRDMPAGTPPAPDVRDGRIGRLLDGRWQVVPFSGRDEELADLAGWRDGSAVTSARLVYGRGGQGKTRFAGRFAELSAAAGWEVLQGRRSGDAAPPPYPSTSAEEACRGPVGTLVVVDYAERWPLADLLALARDERLTGRSAVRLLLLSRTAGHWWEVLAERLETAGVMPDSVALAPLAGTAAERAVMFRTAARRFAAVLGEPDPVGLPLPAVLDEDDGGHALTVHMAALVAAETTRWGGVVPHDAADLSRHVLRRERDHWQAMHDKERQPLATGPQDMGRAVFVAALTGPVSYAEGLDALTRAGIPTPAQVLDDHRLCYPPEDPDSVLEALAPDRIAEDYLAELVPRAGGTGIADSWSLTVPVRILADGSDGPRYAGRAVTVLVECAIRWPHVARRLLAPLLQDHPRLAASLPGAALSRLAAIPEIDADTLQTIQAALPADRRPDLDVGLAAVTRRLVELRLDQVEAPAERADLLRELSRRLSLAGDHPGALAAVERAVAVCRQLPAEARDVRLAGLLRDLAERLTYVDRRPEALAAARESVQLTRSLVSADEPRHLPELAKAINALSVTLGGVGRDEEALACTRQVVHIHRVLAGRDRSDEPALAMALNNLSVDLSALDRMSDSLIANEEAVAILERLTAAAPGPHEPDLAMMLGNLGIRLLNVGRPGDAVVALVRSVGIHRRLSGTNPAFRLDLAWSLSTLGWAYAADSDIAAAVAVAHEAIDLFEDVDEPVPSTFTDERYDALREMLAVLTARGFEAEAEQIRGRLTGPALVRDG